MKAIFTLISYCLGSCILLAQLNVNLVPTTETPPPEVMDQFLSYQIVELDHQGLYTQWQSGLPQLNFTLEVSGQSLDIKSDRYDPRSPDYQLLTDAPGGNGKIVHPRGLSATYRGLVDGAEDQTAIFTVDQNFLLGYWQNAEEEFFLEPLWRFWDAAPGHLYVLYTTQQIAPDIGVCGTTDDHVTDRPVGQSPESIGECIEVEIAVASDFELFVALGSSVTAVENFFNNNLALVQTNWDGEIGDDEFEDELRFFNVGTYIATSEATDPWTNSTDTEVLLPDFRTWGNNGGFGFSYDVASLWSGRDFDGATIGFAYVGVICDFSRYNILENFSANSAALRTLWSHELGHNFSAQHDDANATTIMRPSFLVSNTWSQDSRDAINAHYQGASCLDNCPQQVPAVSFTVSDNPVCPGASVTFTNTTDGTVSNFSWSFPGGTPSTSNELNPTVTYNNLGSFTATLTASNSAGSNSAQETIVVSDGGAEILLTENFEDADIGDLTIDNPDNNTTWELANVSGNGGTIALRMNNYSTDLSGQRDEIDLPSVDMTARSGLRLQYEYAYARFNANLADRMEVKVTTPNGISIVFVGEEDGSGNFATAPDNTDPFVPNSPDDWCFNGPQCIDLDLSAFDGIADVQVSIVNISGFGNLMYVDNIVLSSICSPPNPAPVEWLSFTARPVANAAQLDWTVNQDEFHRGFYVERSPSTSSKWQTLDFVPNLTNEVARMTYSYRDNAIESGVTYLYRLRQVDQDGSEDISVVRSVRLAGDRADISVFPNPNRGAFTLNTNGQSGDYEITDLGRRVLAQGLILGNNTDINMAALPRGVYVLKVSQDNAEVKNIRIVRQ